MNRLAVSVLATVAAANLVLAGCTQAAPTPTTAPPAPTTAPAAPVAPTKAAAPAKAAEPTKAPTAQPTAVPAKKVDYPAKGKTITVIIPYAAGGGTSVAARVLTTQMEPDLGVPIEIVNKPGGGAQVGLTELAMAKPDGYTLGYTVLPTAMNTYLDPARQAVYARKDFQTIACQYDLPYVLAVLQDSPYKTVKDIVDDAKANPEKVKAGTTGLMGLGHLTALQLQKSANVKFALVHFDGSAPQTTALLGGHIDIGFLGVNDVTPHLRSGAIRVLGTAREQPKDLPNVPTFESMGYAVNMSAVGGLSAPAGTPREIVDILSKSAKKAIESPEHQQKMAELGFPVRYMDPDQFSKYWSDLEAMLKPFILEQAAVK